MCKTPFHLVEYSPWPILMSFSILGLPMGFIYMIKYQSNTMSYIAGIMVLWISYLWFRDIVRESTYQGHHTSYVVKGLKLGMLLFILSEVCFFFSIFWSFFHSALAPTMALGGSWPPVGITPINPFQLPLLATVILLISGVSITWAHHSLESGRKLSCTYGLLVTVLLGIYFLSIQYHEYCETSYSMADSVFGSVFYLGTGFHGLHVMLGALFLSVCLIRHHKYHFSKTHHVGFLSAAWYWHFVDVVWLFLYISFYWWGS